MAEVRERQLQPCSSDLELLRRYEPVVRYTRGEEFFPTHVDRYVEACSLWAHRPDGRDEPLVGKAGLSLETLGQTRRDEFGAVHYLKLIEPLNVAELTAYLLEQGVKRLRGHQERFRAELGRLARVGYGSRLLAAIFALSLLLRGRVPGETAAAAAITFRKLREQDDQPTYFGRVVHDDGWIALQYWFFYYFNDWRSGFYGVNDHEADWEMITVYLSHEPDGQAVPRWVAYASHDFHGDDLRRRWDDSEELELYEGHPVVYAGAGSHASYFRPGEYLTEVDIPHLALVVRLANAVRAFWVRTLRQAGADAHASHFNTFRIPFVDYARGDGVRIGVGQDRPWKPVLLEPVPAWVSQYRGLWGLYARDPLSGENAPSGPMFNRDGSIRMAWYDPVGWAGLDKVPPPAREREVQERRSDTLAARQIELDAEVAAKSVELHQLGVELAALRGHPHLEARYKASEERLRRLSAEVGQLRSERAHGQALAEALGERAARLEAGVADDPRAHIRRRAEPATDTDLQSSRWVEGWAAVSIGLMLVGLVCLLIWAREYLIPGMLAMAAAFVCIESILRRQVARLISGITVALAVVSALVLVYQFYWQIAVSGMMAAGLYLTWLNVRELRR
ncbi:MAG TPA: hypothetical protein VEQ11_01425 [Chloroflexota bacterium]|nr:hypothetical protein [Chloroflexota bacterium]